MKSVIQPTVLSSNQRPFKPIIELCLVAAVLLTVVLWLVPGMPHYGYYSLRSQADVALVFLSASGLVIILATYKMLQVKQSIKGTQSAILAFGSLCLIAGLLLAFMLLLVKLIAADALYTLVPQSPVETAFMLLSAAALSLVILLKVVLKISQPKSH